MNSNYIRKSGLTWKPEALKLSNKLGCWGWLVSVLSQDHRPWAGLKLRAEPTVEAGSKKRGQSKLPWPRPGKASAPSPPQEGRARLHPSSKRIYEQRHRLSLNGTFGAQALFDGQ